MKEAGYTNLGTKGGYQIWKISTESWRGKKRGGGG